MKKRIYVKASMASSLEAFLNKEKIDIEIVTNQQGDVEVIQCEGPKESKLDIIYSGGWITCETARDLAKKIKIPLDKMGKLLNYLDVKIRKCGLGCFK
ncbi:MAG: hypothetical protein ABIG61_10910 [Planctomycetota bacterium]